MEWAQRANGDGPGQRGVPLLVGRMERAGVAIRRPFPSPGQVMTGRPSGRGRPPVATLSDPANT
jgi:hypothetical protein